MRTRHLLLTVLGALLFADNAASQSARPPDGTLVERTPCPAYSAPTYEAAVAAAKAAHAEEVAAAKSEGLVMRTPPAVATREEFEPNVAATRRVECTRIVYMSDGLNVAGLMWRPVDQGDKRLPLIIFNRGGNTNFGRVPPWHGFHRLAAEGFVVFASQYRGVDGGEGIEEFGGADVHDILNLVPVAKSLGIVDLRNVFMLGWSRGAMSTFLALKQGITVNAIAVGGGLLNLVTEAERRPALVKNVWSRLMPGFAANPQAVLEARSVMYWPEQITVPVLIMHGGGDWRASPAESMTLAQKLHTLGKSYELIVYANDDHGVSVNVADRNRRIIDWFRRHMR